MSTRSLLIFFAAVSAVALAPSSAAAQQYECHVVKPGETVAVIAQRVTGKADIRHSSWLRVIDTSRSTVVPRREYDRIRPGWQVCIETWLIQDPSWFVHRPTHVAVSHPIASDYRWWAVPSVPAAAVIWFFAKRYRDRRSRTLDEMRQFADIFIREFEQPLIQRRGTDPPVRSQVHCMPGNKRLKIFLAPSAGRSYPNLSDHRMNVEYDVARVLRALPDAPLVSDRPYSQGSWVVIPFQFKSSVASPKFVVESPGRGVRLARRDDRACREHVREEQRRQPRGPQRAPRVGVEEGCPAREFDNEVRRRDTK